MHKHDDDNADLDDSVVAEEQAAETVKKLREKLREAEAEKLEYLTGWQRAKADMINSRKRDEDERRNFVKYANENLVTQLLPVLESFDMAIDDKETWDKADKNWRRGVESIYSQLKKVLTENGAKEIDPLNEKYDHSHHEAVSYVPVDDKALDQTIVKVIQKGYSLGGRSLKAPKVAVGEFKPH
jgi:molecular chaperone GrpE